MKTVFKASVRVINWLLSNMKHAIFQLHLSMWCVMMFIFYEMYSAITWKQVPTSLKTLYLDSCDILSSHNEQNMYLNLQLAQTCNKNF